MNLIDEFYPQGFDIIFCRNVTIYFEIETVKQVIEKFYQSLNEEGYLFTGGTETLLSCVNYVVGGLDCQKCHSVSHEHIQERGYLAKTSPAIQN